MARDAEVGLPRAANLLTRSLYATLRPRQQAFVRSQQRWVNNLNSISKFGRMPPR